MTEAERARRTAEWFRKSPEWNAYLVKSLAGRQADVDKVDAAYWLHGVQAAQDMARVLGRPTPPDEVCGLVEELEARRADGGQDEWLRKMSANLGVSELEMDALLMSAG